MKKFLAMLIACFCGYCYGAEQIVVATVMTSKTGGKLLADGTRNNANQATFVALPSRKVLGRTVTVYSFSTRTYCTKIPVRDVGPHSVNDRYWEQGRLPWAVGGYSDKYGRAKNQAGLDLSLQLCNELGLTYPFRGMVAWWFDDVDKNPRAMPTSKQHAILQRLMAFNQVRSFNPNAYTKSSDYWSYWATR